MSDHLLPPSATGGERALAGTIARVSDVPVPLAHLWRPETCPADILPWLAWALSVDEWSPDWTEDVKRAVIAESVDLHRKKGTVWAVRRALTAAGYADAVVTEGLDRLVHDGTADFDGLETYGSGARWALFAITVDIGETEGISPADMARLTRLVNMAKPESRHLHDVTWTATLADEAAMAEEAAMTGDLVATEPACFGLCYDGAIDHDQATLIGGHDPTGFDGTWRHDGSLDHTGLSSYSRWDVTGHRYDNDRDALALTGANLALDEALAMAAPPYDGRAVHDGAAFYGTDRARATDAVAMTVTWQVRHNGRASHDGQRFHAPAFSKTMTA